MPDGGPFGPASVVVFGLFSAAAWGAGDFAGGLASRRLSVFTVVLGMEAAGMLVALGLAAARAEPPPGPADAAWAVLAGALGSIGIVALYEGLARGRMGVVAPVTGVLAATVPVLAGIALEGLPTPVVAAGIAAAIGAVVLVSRVPDARAGRQGLGLALVAGLGFGSFNVAISRVDETLVFGPLTIVRLAATGILAAALLAMRRRVAIPRRLVPAIAGIGVLDMAGNAGFLLAEQTGELAVASVLSSLYPVTTVILAALVLREPVTPSHAVGIGLALVAIVLIASGAS